MDLSISYLLFDDLNLPVLLSHLIYVGRDITLLLRCIVLLTENIAKIQCYIAILHDVAVLDAIHCCFTVTQNRT